MKTFIRIINDLNILSSAIEIITMHHEYLSDEAFVNDIIYRTDGSLIKIDSDILNSLLDIENIEWKSPEWKSPSELFKEKIILKIESIQYPIVLMSARVHRYFNTELYYQKYNIYIVNGISAKIHDIKPPSSELGDSFAAICYSDLNKSEFPIKFSHWTTAKEFLKNIKALQ